MDPPSGERLLNALTSSSDLVVFSAAVPQQGGDSHINEQYQSHWAAKFAHRGFQPFDLIRPLIWGHPDVCWWYQQNILVYANSLAQKRYELSDSQAMIDVIHPVLYNRTRNPDNWGGRPMARAMVKKVKRRLTLRH